MDWDDDAMLTPDAAAYGLEGVLIVYIRVVIAEAVGRFGDLPGLTVHRVPHVRAVVIVEAGADIRVLLNENL